MSSSFPSTAADGPSAAAAAAFGARLPLAEQYARLLADVAEPRGLIGPREVPRLWPRHLLNSTVLTPLLPRNAEIADIGTGAGLPGIPLAIARPDVTVHLIESRQRPVIFLREAVAALQLGDQVEIIHSRVEDLAAGLDVHTVTARAVADLASLVRWGAPLLREGGEFLLLRGERAPQEAADATSELRRQGWELECVQHSGGAEPTWVTRVARRAKGGR